MGMNLKHFVCTLVNIQKNIHPFEFMRSVSHYNALHPLIFAIVSNYADSDALLASLRSVMLVLGYDGDSPGISEKASGITASLRRRAPAPLLRGVWGVWRQRWLCVGGWWWLVRVLLGEWGCAGCFSGLVKIYRLIERHSFRVLCPCFTPARAL